MRRRTEPRPICRHSPWAPTKRMNDHRFPLGPVSWRSWLRISVRGLLILVLLLGAWLGWIARSARVQREAVAAIKKAGGHVEYDWHENSRGDVWPPFWFVDRIGIDYCLNVVYVGLLDDASSRVLVHVASLNRLQTLDLGSTTVSDAGLEHLERLRSLKTLNLSSTNITDVELRHLKGLTRLEALDLHWTRITDAGLVHLKGLTGLRELDLGDTEVTVAGAGDLRRTLPKLTISWTGVFNIH